MPLLDGPRIAPASGRPADALVVFLHGYGADGRDLIDIGGTWAELLPDVAFVSPHAPEPCGEAPVGRQWFPLSLHDPRELVLGTQGALPGLSRFLAEELSVLGLPWNRLVLFGFSQGAMMALSLAVTTPETLAAVVGASGLYPPVTGGAPARTVSPTLLLHGAEDDLISAVDMFASAEALNALGVPVEWHLSHELGHGLDEAGLFHAGHFIARRLAAGK